MRRRSIVVYAAPGGGDRLRDANEFWGARMTGRPTAVPTVPVSNERMQVTEWRFAPGAETAE